MSESFEKSNEHFKFPNVEEEIGEFERVQDAFGVSSSVLMFSARDGEMVSLGSNMWHMLDNTDSNSFSEGDWKAVHDHSNPNGEFKRDWEDLRNKIQKGKILDAPIVMQYGDKFHLVSGNTRLMVSRALGITPKVLLFEVDSWTKEPKPKKKPESDDS